MNDKTNKGQIWNKASIDGLILSAVAVGANLLMFATGKIPAGSSTATLLLSLAVPVLWAGKTIGSYYLLKHLISKAMDKSPQIKSAFSYGIKVTLFSSLVCAAYTAFNLLVLAPQSVSQTIETVIQMGQGALDSNSLAMLESFKDYIPLYSTVMMFITSYLVGIIFSAIIQNTIFKKTGPFTETSDNN